jgi:ABC-type polysaccharide/polyol phosphate transport system ATPase subunit
MKSENVIEFDCASKVFSRNYRSARYQLALILRDAFLGCRDKSSLNEGEFWALKDVTLEVRKNENVAILGPNGSGKSTLLKMISGIYLPDNGKVSVRGSISSILELSTGFKPELSGRENIYLKFSLMGKSKDEVDAVIHEVIAFSQLDEFMDTPLKHYSSGMRSKLGFSIVTQFRPEILILDEVFAAGDKHFRKKSQERMNSFYESTTTIVVSHNMEIVRQIADRVIVMQKGQKVYDGQVQEGIAYYEEILR